MKKYFFTLFVLFSMLQCVYAGDIYVSQEGSDTNDGTKESPLKTIERALRMAREWRRTNDVRAEQDIHIYLQSGTTFELDEPLYIRPEDSGTKHSKTIITSSGKDKAFISGGKSITKTTEIKKSHSSVRISGRSVLTQALWSKEKKYYCASHMPVGEMERILGFDVKSETVTIPSSSLLKYGITHISDAPQLEIVLHQRWAIAIMRVKDFYFDADKAILSFYNPESRWEFSHPWPQPLIEGERGSSGFYLRNAKQFLDSSDEWWQDYVTGRIYTYNEMNDITIPYLNRILTVEGCAGDVVHDVVFSNIGFSYAAWLRPAKYGHVTLQGGFPIIDAYKLTENEGLPWAQTLENQAWIVRPEAAVSIYYAERVNFVNCQFSHLASTALDYVRGCKDVNILGNKFFDIGGTAILAGSFLEGATEVHRPYGMKRDSKDNVFLGDEEYTEGFVIADNHIDDATNEDWGAVAIGCGFVRNFKIQKNVISNVNYSGISVGWGWTPNDTGMRNNMILDNTVEKYAKQLYDAGGIYTMSNQPNSIIRGNVVSAPTLACYATNYRAFPIYFDACTDGFTVESNDLQVSEILKEKYGYNTPGPSMKIE